MEHPGVKSLLDRIFKQNKPTVQAEASDSGKQLKKFNEIDLNSEINKPSSFTRLTDFKENLKQRMKARRCQIRKEEEEDDKLDEEYHLKPDDEDTNQVDDASKENKKTDQDEADEDESSDESNFKLNLNEDDDENDETSKSAKKKAKKSKTNKLSCYDFGDEEEEEELPDLHTKKKDIPLTNSIPSNQLTKDNVLSYNAEFNMLNSQDDPDRVFLESQFLVSNKQRRSLDELTNISFNYETASNHTNTNHQTPNTTTTSTNINGNSAGKSSNKSGDNTLNDEVLFDELAMLCSGQFRQGANTQKAKATQPKEKELTNEDLYAADEGDDYDNEMRNKVLFTEEESTDSERKKTDEEEEENSKLPESSPEEVESPKKTTTQKTTKKIEEEEEVEEEEEEEELDEDKEESLEDILDDEDVEESNDADEKSAKRKVSADEESGDEDPKEGFFEKEAELSGSEDEDEDYDANSEDEKGLIFSGDEDELPSDSEIKQQLGKFYLKEQMDEDKRQIRMFKEMYLADGELHSKESRRKQFRWKHLEDNGWCKNYRNSSSEEEEEDEDENEENKEDETEDSKKKKSEEKANKYAKLLATRNWRLNRHEREQFVRSKSDKTGLLSDEEHEDENDEENSECSEDDENTKMSSTSQSSTSQNQILKKGQQLLKQTLLNRTDQNKRTLTGENNPISRAETEMKPTQQLQKSQAEKQDLLKKFSFLNRDKSYLSRLSNYVNKNFSGAQHMMSSGTAGVDYVAPIKPIKKTNMVFTTLNNPANYCDDTSAQTSNTSTSSKKPTDDLLKQKSTSNSSSPVVVTSLPKRTKYDTCESVFNHLN